MPGSRADEIRRLVDSLSARAGNWHALEEAARVAMALQAAE
jgi:hypothetical protein